MKFGHAFQEALAAESFPQHWVEKAIPYRQLKKLLGKVREELIKTGYAPDTIHQLLADHNAEYRLETDASHLLRPKLVVRPSPGSTPPELAVEPNPETSPELDTGPCLELGILSKPTSPPLGGGSGCASPHGSDDGLREPDDDEWVKIPLNSDGRFFSLLQTDVTELDTLQDEERQSMNDRIRVLGVEIAEVAKPRRGLVKFSKSDLYRWREIFELYLAAQVFFSTNEAAGGLRKSEKAQKQLVWFQDEVNKRQLPQKFKIASSAVAYTQFLTLNATLLQNLQFQELNQTAITKIIKSGWHEGWSLFHRRPSLMLTRCPEFDKRTSLGVKSTFPKAMYSAHFISEAISKDICSQLAREVVNVVPQIVDYTCIVCEYPALSCGDHEIRLRPAPPFGDTPFPPVLPLSPFWTTTSPAFIANPRPGLCLCWLPIRLDCSHLFCIRCMIKMQNQNKRHCPLCRAEVVQNANESKHRHAWFFLLLYTAHAHRPAHIDEKLVRHLEQWFPKETKEKQAYNELERRRELLGDIYVDEDPPKCIVM